LISGSGDKTIKVWSKEFSLLKTLDGIRGGSVESLGITFDDLIISGS
jgi:hypothetical protein